ncbi:MAG: glycosyltransferase [Acidimicrobiia bacterium]
MEFDPTDLVGLQAAARHINRCDIVIIQHEFGIFGESDGVSILDLLESIDRPIIAVLHTVLPSPTRRQAAIIEAIAARATPIVLCESARDVLEANYAVAPGTAVVIPHGANWSAQPPNHQPRRELISWGLLGPGKGLERAIDAMGLLRGIDPPVRYRIVGRTHPAVVSRSGTGYRQSLEALVARRGLEDVVEFVDRYVDDTELFDMVRHADLVVVPYDNDDQVSSGVITEALGMGRPVVATRFPYAVELLGGGAGMVVNHDSDDLASAIRTLLEDPITYRRAARAAGEESKRLGWGPVARSYSRLIHELSPALATA